MGLVVIATRPTLISGHHRTDTSEDDEQLEADLRLAIANQIRGPPSQSGPDHQALYLRRILVQECRGARG